MKSIFQSFKDQERMTEDTIRGRIISREGYFSYTLFKNGIFIIGKLNIINLANCDKALPETQIINLTDEIHIIIGQSSEQTRLSFEMSEAVGAMINSYNPVIQVPGKAVHRENYFVGSINTNSNFLDRSMSVDTEHPLQDVKITEQYDVLKLIFI